MTEIDAIPIAAMDAAEALRRAAEAQGPEDVVHLVLGFFVHRVAGLDGGVATSTVEQSFSRSVTAPTFSEEVVERSSRALRAAATRLCAEDAQSLCDWLCGVPSRGEGFLVPILQNFEDNGTSSAVARLRQAASALRRKLADQDEHDFRQVLPGLDRPSRSIVQGMLLEARWAAEDQDGETARSRLVNARRLLHFFSRRTGTRTETETGEDQGRSTGSPFGVP